MLDRDEAQAAARGQIAKAREDISGSVALLYEVLAEVRPAIGPATAERLRRDLHDYIEGVARQQAVRQDRLPDPDHLFNIRCDDIGAAPSITLNEYAMDFELPDAVRNHEAAESIARDCTRVTLLGNEIHSCEKEFVSLSPS